MPNIMVISQALSQSIHVRVHARGRAWCIYICYKRRGSDDELCDSFTLLIRIVNFNAQHSSNHLGSVAIYLRAQELAREFTRGLVRSYDVWIKVGWLFVSDQFSQKLAKNNGNI